MTKTPWLHRFHPVAAPRRTLVCFPHAGAGAALYRDWVPHLGPGDELLSVRLPGRESRFTEACATDAAAVAQPLSGLLARLDRPLVLFGHSLGAALAYATARALIAAGRPPDRLAVSARRAPHIPLRRPHTASLDDTSFRARIRSMGGTPPEVLACDELMDLVIPMLRADFILSDSFADPDPAPLPIPLLAFAGIGDAEVAVEDVAAWERLAGAGFALHPLPGDHFFLHQHRQKIVQTLLYDAP